MRRVISISTTLALLLSLASPLLAEVGMSTSGRASCHRVGHAAAIQHHCDGMPGHEEMSIPASGGSISSVSSECPMSCCTLDSAGKPAAFAVPVIFPPAMAVSNKLHSV